MRSKVMDAAEQLGYRPSLIPRIMLTHRSYLVAIAIGGMYNPINSAVLEQFTVKLQEIGHQVLLVHVDDENSLNEIIPRLASYRVDAIFIARAVLSARSANEFARFKIPIISFNTPVKNLWVSSVCSDGADGGRLMADHLVEQGARRMAFLSGPRRSASNEERLSGFREGLRARGIDAIRIVETTFTYEGGGCAAKELFSSGHRPDAVFCTNDLVAIGAMDAIRKELGRRVPEDVMVAGFDNISAASWASYDLTTLVQDGPLMVEASLAILRSATESSAAVGGVRTVVPVRLIRRGSTRRATPPDGFGTGG
jgi:DNA-binding LacI/PurR family transcriptional regulator